MDILLVQSIEAYALTDLRREGLALAYGSFLKDSIRSDCNVPEPPWPTTSVASPPLQPCSRDGMDISLVPPTEAYALTDLHAERLALACGLHS